MKVKEFLGPETDRLTKFILEEAIGKKFEEITISEYSEVILNDLTKIIQELEKRLSKLRQKFLEEVLEEIEDFIFCMKRMEELVKKLKEIKEFIENKNDY